jgi:hypothetical protein
MVAASFRACQASQKVASARAPVPAATAQSAAMTTGTIRLRAPVHLQVRQPLQNQRFKVARLVGPKLLIGVGQERDKTLGVFFHQRLVADEPEPLAMSALDCEPKPSEIVDVKFLLRELQSALDSSAEAFVFVAFAHRCAPVARQSRHRSGGFERIRAEEAHGERSFRNPWWTGAFSMDREVRLAGFEPATRGLEVRCSVH